MSTEPEVDPVSLPGTETKTLPGVLSEIRWWVRDIFFAVGTAIMIVVFLYQPVKVEGTSMLPRLHATLRFAAACGALTVTRQGSFSAMPDEAEVLAFMDSRA